VNATRNRAVPEVEYARCPLRRSVEELLPLWISTVCKNAGEDALFKALIAEHHYLGLQNTVGEGRIPDSWLEKER